METVIQIQQVLVQHLHGTLMGPVVESYERDTRTDLVYRVLKWEVSNGTVLEKDLPHGWLGEVVPNNFNKSYFVLKIARKRKVDDTYEDGYPDKQVKSVGQENLIPAEFRKFVTQKVTTRRLDLAKERISDVPAVPALSGDVAQIQHVKVDDHNYDEITTEEILLENVAPLFGQQTGAWGVEGTSKQLVIDGTATPSGFGTKAAETRPLGNGKSVEQVETYPAVASAGVVYTLSGEETDELTGIVIDIERSLVDAAQAKAIAAVQRAAPFERYTEIQPLDKWHSILIASKLSGTPGSQTWTESGNISLPDVLQTAGVIWDQTSDKDQGAAGVDNIADIISNEWQWHVSAEAAVVGSVMGRPYTLRSNGFKGAVEVTVVRTFTKGPPVGAIAVTAFNPVYGVITIHGANGVMSSQSHKRGVGDIGTSFGTKGKFSRDEKLVIQEFGPIVHSSVTLTETGDSKTLSESQIAWAGSTPGGGVYPVATASLSIVGRATLSIPASSAPLTSGATYIIHVETKPWRFGYWMREVYTATVP